MNAKTLQLDKLIDWLRQEAASPRSTLIVSAEIAIGPVGAKLLEIQSAGKLEVIQY